MPIPYYLQYYVEKERNSLYQWLSFIVCLSALVVHGMFFHWVPKWVRQRRNIQSHNYVWVLKIVKLWESFNGSVSLPIPKTSKVFYFQPSIFLLCSCYILLQLKLAYVATIDLNYEPRYYIIAKRLGRLASSNLPLIFLFVTKSDLLRYISGLHHERLVFLHRWLGRSMWGLVTTHMGLSIYYWLDLGFPVMMEIPPQIFGFISYSCLVLLAWASLRFIRRLSFEFFLIQHRVFSFIMLLLAFFHNMDGNKGIIILAVHLLVLDRIVSRVVGIIHSKYSPTKGVAKFQVLDDDTILVTIPLKTISKRKWWMKFLPSLRTWKAGQHIYLSVHSVNKLQQHPFTISSLPESGKMKILIRKQNGFTKRLMRHLNGLSIEDTSICEEALSERKGISYLVVTVKKKASSYVNTVITAAKSTLKYPVIFIKSKLMGDSEKEEETYEDDEVYIPEAYDLKVSFHGPYGSFHQPFITFDSLLFISAGSGASYTFPVALDLLQTIMQKEVSQDFLYRPRNPRIHFVWSVKHVDNILWYKHALEKLVPFTDTNMLTIDIFISQGTSLQYSSVNSESGVEEKFQEQGSYYKTDASDDVLSVQRTREKSILSILSSCISPSVNFIYQRPKLNTIIDGTVDDIINGSGDSIEKSLAVVSCGPIQFKKQIEHRCQRNRWKRNSPDIYCYSESYS